MGDPKGFLDHPPGAARRAGRWTCGCGTGARSTRTSRATDLEKQAGPLHELRHPVLPPGLSAGQPHPGVERPGLPPRLARGHRAAARHQQLPRVHRHALPRPVRGGVRAGDQLRRRHDQAGRDRDHRPGVGRGLGAAAEGARPAPGKKVAVVGSGPAGLAAAQQLTRVGHDVVVFERADRIGGLLRYGIPEFKMEKARLDRRLAQMRDEGTIFQASVDVGTDVTAEQLRAEFDAVVLAGGATAWRDLPAPGPRGRGRLPGDGVPAVGQPRAAGRHRRAADHRRGQARGDHRRRRHRRRLPRAPRTGRAPRRSPSWRSCRRRRSSAPRACRGRPTRWSTASRRRTRRAASGCTR